MEILIVFFSKKSTFRPIFKKCRPSSVILKIVGATLQLDQNINPQDICPDNFSFLYKCLIYLKMKKIKGHF